MKRTPLYSWIPSRRTLIVGLAVVLIVFAYWTYCRALFVIESQKYNAFSNAHTNFAYAPAAEENPVRNELNRVLSEVLARPMSEGERIELAKRGLDMLRGMELQIDRIGTSGEETEIQLNRAEWAGYKFGNIFIREKVREVFLHAREEVALIADIRGLSYRANFHTEQILKRVVEDRGALTAEHVSALNRELPQVEIQFNERTNLYATLQSEHLRTEKEFKSIRGVTFFTRMHERYLKYFASEP